MRKVDPNDILVPQGYKVDVFYVGLTTPINIAITENGEFYVGDAGVTDGDGKLIHLTKDGPVVVANGFHPPLTGVTYHNGEFYISHQGKVTKVTKDGNKVDLIVGLPSYGDHQNNRVEFGKDGKMYFGQGTATNSGVVGVDNQGWVKEYPFFHDYPGGEISLMGRNFETPNFLTNASDDTAFTGAFSPFNITTYPSEKMKKIKRANGSILRANLDGSHIELIAWGLRNPFMVKFDKHNRLYATNHGMDVRGSRPIANSPDEFQLIEYGNWYGWPDYTGGLPITLSKFKPEHSSQPLFLLKMHPMVPPQPIATFTPHSATMGFSFNYDPEFGLLDQCFVAEFGSEAPETTGGELIPHVGHKISRIDMNTHNVFPFAVNESGTSASYSGGGGFERPIDIAFFEHEMYIVDFGIVNPDKDKKFIPNTGVIWKISKVK